MADVKISQLPAATTPLDGTELAPIVQSGTTKRVSVANLTVGRALTASSLTLTTPLSAANGGTGLTSLGTGIATFLATPTSANLAAAVTDETGTGALVFASSPTIATPTLSTSFTSPLHIGGTTASSTLTLQSTSGVGTSDSIVFKVGNNGATTAATFDTSGNLGVGTTSPNGRVHGRQDSAGGTTYTLIADNGASGAGTNLAAVAFQNVGARKASIRAAVYGDGYMAFHTDNDTEKMRISANGTFRVKGAGTAGSTDAFLVDGGAPASAARIDSSGNLLVGTTSLAYNTHRLTVSGGEQFLNRQTTINSSTATTIAKAGTGIFCIRDISNGGAAFVLFEFLTISIINQIGTVFVTTAPTANEIQLTQSLISSEYVIQALAGSSRNNAAVRVACITMQ